MTSALNAIISRFKGMFPSNRTKFRKGQGSHAFLNQQSQTNPDEMPLGG